MRVLVIEDDELVASGIVAGLKLSGIDTDHVQNAALADAATRVGRFDVLILDLGLPDADGLSLLRQWRTAGHHWPVLVLTARDELGDKVAGLRSGADDYLVKPFEYPELAARLKALLRRSLKTASDVLTLGPLSIDLTAQAVRLNGAALELTAFEYRLLETLVRQRPAIVTRQALSDYLYPHGEDRDSNVLEVLVSRLRRKLDPQGSLGPIETVRARGYRFTLQ